MTTQGTNFVGADYKPGSVTTFERATFPEFLAEGSRGGWAFHGGEGNGRVFYVWPANRVGELEIAAYAAYVRACDAENLDAHGLEMWRVHGNPTGPV